MARLTQDATIASLSPQKSNEAKGFAGFAAPTSNTTFTPNQFFDACLPYNSRGVVRLVAYLIRKTLGWCDASGNPQEEQISISYQDLVSKAGISRDMIRSALDEAVAGHFIECVREGRPNVDGAAGQTASYQLRWDASREYRKRPDEFRGFFEAEGNRTDIPNQFFDVVVPNEPLSVIKVVGAIVRFSIGFQAKHGRRRQQATLSYQEILNYTRLASRADLSKAIQRALERRYIVRVASGVFSPDADQRKPAIYALHWADGWDGQKTEPAPEASEIQTRDGQNSVPGQASEIRTNIQTKPGNETLKQQAAPLERVEELLRRAGFGAKAAAEIARRHSSETIERQVGWIEQRAPAKNRLGLLRRAIEEDWAEPEKVRTSELSGKGGFILAQHFYASFAGNQHEPANSPSVRDTEAGETFLHRVRGIDPGLDPAGVGRELGTLAREQRNPFPSLQVALRQCGDRLVVRLETEQRRAAHAAFEAAREAHLSRVVPMYDVFLRGEDERIQRELPEEYARFLGSRAAERAKLVANPLWLRSPHFMNAFDSEARRLSDLQRFFQLPDFAQWDRTINRIHFDETL